LRHARLKRTFPMETQSKNYIFFPFLLLHVVSRIIKRTNYNVDMRLNEKM
jgi:hypothetical protein